MNNNGGAEFTSVTKTKFDVHEWSRVEIFADASTGRCPHGRRPIARDLSIGRICSAAEPSEAQWKAGGNRRYIKK